jgi:hypothetical protein
MKTKSNDKKEYRQFPIIFPEKHKKRSKQGHIIKRKTGTKKIKKALKIFLIIDFLFLASQLPSIYQMSRYEVDVYDCSDMTKDCYAFFSALGFNVSQMHGEPDGSDPDDYLVEQGQKYLVGHRWLRFHFWFGDYDFECTTLQFRDVANDWDIVWRYEK